MRRDETGNNQNRFVQSQSIADVDMNLPLPPTIVVIPGIQLQLRSSSSGKNSILTVETGKFHHAAVHTEAVGGVNFEID